MKFYGILLSLLSFTAARFIIDDVCHAPPKKQADKIVLPGTYNKDHPWYDHPAFGSSDYVLVIGMDGMGSYWTNEEYVGAPLPLLNTPNLDRFRSQGAWSYHSRGVMTTVSQPNWGAMTCGAGPEEHGFVANGVEVEPITGTGTWFPSVFQAMRDQIPDLLSGVWGSWAGFWDLFPHDLVDISCQWAGADYESFEEFTTDFITDVILPRQHRFMYFYHTYMDGAGHDNGWGSDAWYSHLTVADYELQRLFDALTAAGIAERTTVIITADHGGTGGNHGLNNLQNFATPFFVRGPRVSANHSMPCPFYGHSCFENGAEQIRGMDVPATALFALGLKQPDVWIAQPVTQAFF